MIYKQWQALPLTSAEKHNSNAFLKDYNFPFTSVKLSYELGKITFSTGKPKLTPGEVSTFQGF